MAYSIRAPEGLPVLYQIYMWQSRLILGRSAAASGQQHQFRPPEPSGRYRFGQV